MLTQHDLEKYNQHVLLDNIGHSGQLKLKNATILCIGLGGLGSPVCLYLANAGIGKIGLVDGDKIELSNLPRQILYTKTDLDKYKVTVCKKRLKQINSNCEITAYKTYLTEDNALEIIKNYNIIIDCSDNFSTRYLVNDACCELDKINISASLFKFNGNLSIFPGKTGPCYRCLFESMPEETRTNCNESGVLNTFVGFIALLQAHETIKLILGIGSSCIGKVFSIDGLSMRIQKLTLQKNPFCPTCSHGMGLRFFNHRITYQQFLSMKQLNNHCLLIDVRSEEEFNQDHLKSSINIPIDKIIDNLPTRDKNASLILYCQTGKRSAIAREKLLRFGYKNVFDIYPSPMSEYY